MSINEVIKFIYSNTTDDYIIVDCQILEELVENLKNNTKPIYPLDEIKGVITDIKASLPINKEMENTLEEFVAEIDSKFFNGDKIEESIEEKLSDNIRDWIELAKEKYSEIKNDSRKADMLDMCKDGYEFAEYEINKYSKGTVDLDFTKPYISEVKKAIKKNDFTTRFFYFLSALGRVYAFDLEEILESMGKLSVGRVKSMTKKAIKKMKEKKLFEKGIRYNSITTDLIQNDIELFIYDNNLDIEIIDNGRSKGLEVKYFYICKGKGLKKIKSENLYDYLFSENGVLYHNLDFGVEVNYNNSQITISLPNTKEYNEKKSAKIPNIGYKKMGDIIANMSWDKLDSANFKNMGYRLDDFYVDERFAINQKDYMKAFNKCEDNPKMLGKEVNIKATRLADNQPLTIICELDERADVEKLYMYDFNIVEVMLDTF